MTENDVHFYDIPQTLLNSNFQAIEPYFLTEKKNNLNVWSWDISFALLSMLNNLRCQFPHWYNVLSSLIYDLPRGKWICLCAQQKFILSFDINVSRSNEGVFNVSHVHHALHLLATWCTAVHSFINNAMVLWTCTIVPRYMSKFLCFLWNHHEMGPKTKEILALP